MFAKSAARVLGQLPILCQALKIPEEYQEGFFHSREVAREGFTWLTEGDIAVSVGEVHMGCQHILTFDVGGQLKSVRKVEWNACENPRYRLISGITAG